MAPIEVGIELTNQGGHRGSKCTAIIVQRPSRSVVERDHGDRLMQPIPAFDGAAYLLFMVDRKDASPTSGLTRRYMVAFETSGIRKRNGSW